MYALALFLVAQHAAPAGALDTDPRFQSARAAMQALEYERAQQLFDALAAEPHDAKDGARLYVWSGTARALLGDDMAARLAFENAVRLDDACVLEWKTSPKVGELLEEARAKIRAERTTARAADEARLAVEREAKLARQRAAPAVTGAAVPTPTAPAATEPVPRAAASEGAPLPLWLGAGAGALVGVVALGVGGVLGWQAKTSADVAADKATPQANVQDHVDAANALIGAAAGAGGIGAVALAVSIGVAIVALKWEDEPTASTRGGAAEGASMRGGARETE